MLYIINKLNWLNIEERFVQNVLVQMFINFLKKKVPPIVWPRFLILFLKDESILQIVYIDLINPLGKLNKVKTAFIYFLHGKR